MDNLQLENNNPSQNGPEQPSKISRKRHIVKSFAAKLNQQRTGEEKVADFFTKFFGSLTFALIHLAWFIIWIVWNMGWINLKPFDPYPFGLLTMIVSLEAIFLAILVLVSQNREAKIDRLRAEVDLQINLTAEQEITKILSLLKVLLERSGVGVKDDPELERMLKQIDAWEIEKKLEKDLGQ
jgi:uncharacterized membrane protein